MGVCVTPFSARLRYPFLGALMVPDYPAFLAHADERILVAYVMSAVFWSLMGALWFLFAYSCQRYFR
ncbi:MAG: hypothetical protein ACR5LF_13930 [Symbiopectobacterium sp.]